MHTIALKNWQYDVDLQFRRERYVNEVRFPLDLFGDRKAAILFDESITQTDAVFQAELYMSEAATADEFRLAFPSLLCEEETWRDAWPHWRGCMRGDLLEDDYLLLSIVDLPDGVIVLSTDRMADDGDIDFHEEVVTRVDRSSVRCPLTISEHCGDHCQVLFSQ